jgi:WD40 repeat protein
LTGGTGAIGGNGGTGPIHPPPICGSIATTANAFNACGRTTSLAFSPDGQLLVAGMEKRPPNVHVWRLSDGGLVRSIDGIGTVTYDVAISPDGRTLATAGTPGGGSSAVTPNIVKLWDFDTGAFLRTLPATSGFYSCTVAFSPDSALVATAGYVGPIEVWRVSDGALVTSIPYPTTVHNVHFAPTGTRLIAGGVDGRATIWEIPSGTQLMTLSKIADEMADADFSPDSTEIASTGPGHALVLWNATTGAVLQTLPGHTWFVSHVVWVGPDRLISNDWRGSIRSWTRSPGAAFAATGEWMAGGQSLGIAVSPDRQKLVVGGADPTTGVEGFRFLPL